VQDPKEITKLKDAIRAMHGCESLHVESVAVKEVFEGQLHWKLRLKFSILSVIAKRNALMRGVTATAIKIRRLLYSKFRQSIRRIAPSKSQSQASTVKLALTKRCGLIEISRP
jgi:hypothetical protein